MGSIRANVLAMVAGCGLMFAAGASAQSLNTQAIAEALGRPGQQNGAVYKVGFPRTDLQVRLAGVALKPGFALGSWAAFSGNDQHAMVMGDLVLLEQEVNPVLDALLASGFEVTGLHNHLLKEQPHVMYMHYMGSGPAVELAQKLKAALGHSATPLAAAAAGGEKGAEASPSWVAAVETALGRKGKFKGGVLAVAVPRAGEIRMGDTTLTPAMGVAESMNFQSVGAGHVAATGDFVLTGEEVTPVLQALATHHVQVEAVHNHMLSETPRLFFVHFWAVGPAGSVGSSLKAALDHIATQR